jgi:site-specific recombinase XerD
MYRILVRRNAAEKDEEQSEKRIARVGGKKQKRDRPRAMEEIEISWLTKQNKAQAQNGSRNQSML